jgi:hypothetical protein
VPAGGEVAPVGVEGVVTGADGVVAGVEEVVAGVEELGAEGVVAGPAATAAPEVASDSVARPPSRTPMADLALIASLSSRGGS